MILDDILIYVLLEDDYSGMTRTSVVSLDKDFIVKTKQELEKEHKTSDFSIEIWKNNQYQGPLD